MSTLLPRRDRMFWVRAPKRGCGLMHASGTSADSEIGPPTGWFGEVKSPTPRSGKLVRVGAIRPWRSSWKVFGGVWNQKKKKKWKSNSRKGELAKEVGELELAGKEMKDSGVEMLVDVSATLPSAVQQVGERGVSACFLQRLVDP